MIFFLLNSNKSLIPLLHQVWHENCDVFHVLILIWRVLNRKKITPVTVTTENLTGHFISASHISGCVPCKAAKKRKKKKDLWKTVKFFFIKTASRLPKMPSKANAFQSPTAPLTAPAAPPPPLRLNRRRAVICREFCAASQNSQTLCRRN